MMASMEYFGHIIQEIHMKLRQKDQLVKESEPYIVKLHFRQCVRNRIDAQIFPKRISVAPISIS